MREDGNYFSLIVDEAVTDHHANKEITSLCFRFVQTDDNESSKISEIFFDFVDLERQTGEGITSAIIKLLLLILSILGAYYQ